MMTCLLLAISIAFTLLTKFFDVAAIGPNGSSVGLAALNGFVHSSIGLHPLFGKLSDLFLIPAFLSILIFFILGIKDLLEKKSLKKVDRRFFYLLGFYFLIAVVYVVFEKLALNFRPILEDGVLEPSFPSSHTLFAVTLYSALILNLDLVTKSEKYQKLLKPLCFVFMTLTIIFRLLAGVHWLTDILGGVLIGATLVSALRAISENFATKQPSKTAPARKSE